MRSDLRKWCKGGQDVQETRRYIQKLTLAGLDEIAQFIITPIPGSALMNKITGYQDKSRMTFSPVWRTDYHQLQSRRLRQYLLFLFWKTLRYPHRVLMHVVRIFQGKFKLKLEQAIFRVTLWRLLKFAKLKKHVG